MVKIKTVEEGKKRIDALYLKINKAKKDLVETKKLVYNLCQHTDAYRYEQTDFDMGNQSSTIKYIDCAECGYYGHEYIK